MRSLIPLMAILIQFSSTALALSDEAIARCRTVYEAYGRCSDRVRVDGEMFLLSVGNEVVKVPCSDGIERAFYERVKSMDIASILSIPYPIGPAPLPYTDDPGRLRQEDLLKAVYGENKEAVARQLRTVKFLGHTVQFNRKNGAAEALEAVSAEIERSAAADPEFARQLKPWRKGHGFAAVSRGTFNWRPIAGTRQLSVHSFGVAIDLAPLEKGLPEYWRWSGKLADKPEEQAPDFPMPARIATFPKALVDVFERHGFIWGNKWRHFDSMHFEYRPEFFPEFEPVCGD